MEDTLRDYNILVNYFYKLIHAKDDPADVECRNAQLNYAITPDSPHPLFLDNEPCKLSLNHTSSLPVSSSNAADVCTRQRIENFSYSTPSVKSADEEPPPFFCGDGSYLIKKKIEDKFNQNRNKNRKAKKQNKNVRNFLKFEKYFCQDKNQ